MTAGAQPDAAAKPRMTKRFIASLLSFEGFPFVKTRQIRAIFS
jgi:hypothetical protein